MIRRIIFLFPIILLVNSLAVAQTVQLSAVAPSLWSGFYAGINSGYAWGKANTTQSISPGANPYMTGEAFIKAVESTGDMNFNPHSFVGGMHLGYNQAFSDGIVLGLETSFDAFPLNQSHTASAIYPGYTSTYTYNEKMSTNWLYTLTPRIGYAHNKLLAFVTGGLALTNLKLSQHYSDNYYTDNPAPPGYDAYADNSASKILPGWALGGGVEYLLNKRLSLEFSYLYTRFASLSMTSYLQEEYGGVQYTGIFDTSIKLSTNLVRLELNYRL